MTDINKAPTVAEEMAKFTGYTTNNGETVAKENTRRGPGDTDLSDAERTAGAKITGGKEARPAADKGQNQQVAATAVKLSTAEENSAVDAARAAAIEAGEIQDDEELDDEARDSAIAAALAEKQKAAKTPKNDAQRRAQEGRRRAEARAARAEGRVQSLEQRLAALEAGGKPLTADNKGGKDDKADKEPDPKDFEFGEVDAKYIRALARWETKQELAASKNQETEQQLTAEQQRAAAEFTAKREAFEDAALGIYPDFMEVVMDTVALPKTDPAAWPLSINLRDLILDSEQGAHIIYALANDPKEARRVDKLTKPEQQRWFFKEEAKLEAKTSTGGENEEDGETAGRREPEPKIANARRISQAPPVPRRNNGASGNRTVSAATTDFRAFEAMAGNQPAKR